MTTVHLERILSADGRIEAVVAPEVGARLHRLTVDGFDLLRTPDDPLEHVRNPLFWGAYPMAPWCNRLDAGVSDVGLRQLALASNHDDGSVMHGEVYARPWQSIAPGHFTVRAGGDGWPWPYEVELRIAAATDALRLELSLRNHADDPMPGGLGLHPWFMGPLAIRIPADSVYRSNAPSPVNPAPVAGEFDRRRLGALARGIDATWTDLTDPGVEIAWPERGLTATMRMTASSVLVCAASPLEFDASAVEPQTHAPQGLRRLLAGEPDPMSWIPPGGALRMTVDLTFDRSSRGMAVRGS